MEAGTALSILLNLMKIIIGFDELITLMSRPIDLLLYKPVYSKIEPYTKVLDLRILCFNNLSCIYRYKKNLKIKKKFR